jgi:mono/diheme cytochrome c family protein
MFTTIRTGVPGTDMPPTNLPDDETWRLVAFVRDLSAPAFESQLPGDLEAGATIFFGKGGCSGCHMIHGRGGFLRTRARGSLASRLREQGQDQRDGNFSH